jgi:hypothetical protein
MSQQYPGGLITKNPVVPSGPYENSSASGVWTMDQAAQYIKAGNWPTAGNVDPSAFIENLFSTYLYTGNGSTQTITNGIDLAGEGGLVWIKSRNASPISYDHVLKTDTTNNYLSSNTTNGNTFGPGQISAFNSNGFTLGDNFLVNDSTAGYNSYASWTFRKQPKFFDVVTYTGNGANRTIAHNLGSVPGCIIVKRTDTTADWQVYHRSIANTEYLVLNSTAAKATGTTRWNSTTPTSTEFSLGTDTTVNANGGTYVAYLFAHDAGGFGLSGTDNVISCGSYTGNGSATGPTITLGYEPQWLLVKNATTAGREWFLMDNMRGFTANGTDAMLFPNNSNSESSQTKVGPTATGFQPLSASGDVNASGDTYIYIAIRRGPMKVPTSGTSVFAPVVSNAADGTQLTAGFPVDMQMFRYREGSVNTFAVDRLRGVGTTTTTVSTPQLRTNLTDAETNTNGIATNWNNTGFAMPSGFGTVNDVFWNFRRAPGFFDIVCYTGTGVARTINHNLAAVPELMIVRRRSSIANWAVNSQSLTASDYLYLNSTDPKADNTSPIIWNSTRPTSTVFSVGTSALTNENAQTFVAYLFATVAGVSKVGSYTGSGTTKQIDCGFTAGARFVLIKRTDSTGDWYVYDSARGIVAGNDPYLLLNSTAAEVTSTDYVDTYSAGFELSSTAPAALNANGGTYIFLAIA